MKAPGPTDWQADAACAPLDVDATPFLLDNPDGLALAAARAICRLCPVRPECLAYALAGEGAEVATNRAGIWAGTTPAQRYAMHLMRGDQW